MSDNETGDQIYEHLLKSVLASTEWHWQIWAREKGVTLDPDVYAALIQRFPHIPEKIMTTIVVSLTMRAYLGIGLQEDISVPILELRMTDRLFPETHHIVLIQGKDNINGFLRDFICRYAEQHSVNILNKTMEKDN